MLAHTQHTSQVPDVSGIVERLLVFLDSNSEDVVAEALVQMKDLLRRYPDMAEVRVLLCDDDALNRLLFVHSRQQWSWGSRSHSCWPKIGSAYDVAVHTPKHTCSTPPLSRCASAR